MSDIVGSVILFIGQEARTWGIQELVAAAKFARSVGVDSISPKRYDGTIKWTNDIVAEYRAVTSEGCGYIPFQYAYGPRFGDAQIKAEAALLVEIGDEIGKARGGRGFVCTDLEAEWDGNTQAGNLFAHALQYIQSDLYVTTWANPNSHGWKGILQALKPVTHAFVPQQYTDYLATRSTDFAGYTIQPALDLSQEFGANHPVTIAQQAGDASVWLWEYGFAQKNPNLVRQIVSTVKGSAPAPTSTSVGGVYQVKWGENLTVIANRYSTTWQQLWSMNRSVIADPNKIYAGQWIRVPSK